MRPILLALLFTLFLTLPADAQGMAADSDPVLTPEVLEAMNDLGPGPTDVGYNIGAPTTGSGLCEINIDVSNRTSGRSRVIKTRSYAVECNELAVDINYRDSLLYIKITLKPKQQPPGGAGPLDPISVDDILKALDALGGKSEVTGPSPTNPAPIKGVAGYQAADAEAAAARFASSVPEVLDLPLAPPFSQGTDLEALNGYDSLRPPAIYRVNHNANTVTRVDGCSPTLTANIRVGSHPLQAVLTPNGKTLVVASFDSVVTFIDTTTNRVTKSLPTPSDFHPAGIDITRDGLLAYIVSFDDVRPALIIVDLTRQTILARFALPYQYPNGLFLTPDGTQAYITHPLGAEVTVFDLLTSSVAATLSIGQPHAIAFNRTGTRAYISASRTVRVFDTSTLLQVDAFDFPGDAGNLEFSADGQFLFIEDYASTRVYTLQLNTRTLRSVDTGVTSPGFTLN